MFYVRFVGIGAVYISDTLATYNPSDSPHYLSLNLWLSGENGDPRTQSQGIRPRQQNRYPEWE